MSIDALAMAGADYTECSIDFEAMDHFGLTEPPPSYLLSEDDRGPIKAAGSPVKKETGNRAEVSAGFSEVQRRKEHEEKAGEELRGGRNSSPSRSTRLPLLS